MPVVMCYVAVSAFISFVGSFVHGVCWLDQSIIDFIFILFFY